MPFKKGEGVNPKTAHSAFARAGREKHKEDRKVLGNNKKEAAVASVTGVTATERAACVGVAGAIRSKCAALCTGAAIERRVFMCLVAS